MTKIRRNRRKKSLGGSTKAALALFLLIAVTIGAYLIAGPTNRQAAKPKPDLVFPLPPHTVSVSPDMPKPVYPAASSSHQKKELETQGAKSVSEAPVHHSATTGRGKLSIIIDDMGSSMQEARSLAAIGVPLTFSIIPGLAHFKEVAAFAGSQEIEVMIHMPMQSKGWPQRPLEPNGLLVSMDGSAIASRVDEYIRLVPGASGANNHMGSEFTEHEEKMRPVLASLKEKGLFFIDSVTTPHSVGYRMARQMMIKTARRKVFLDNEQNRDYIAGQIRQAVIMAGKLGSAIAICHPHPVTISTLAAILPTLKQQGITLTPASQLVEE